MRPSAPAQRQHRHRRPDRGAIERRHRPARREESGSTSSLELMVLTPMLALLVLLILWAGRAGRAELITSLVAEEAAVAAAVCCNSEHITGAVTDPDTDPEPAHGSEREIIAETVIASRPGLDYLCQAGPQPPAGSAGYVTTAQAELSAADSDTDAVQQVLVVTTHVTCETDGATAPVRGLFGTRTLHGHGAHVAVTASMPHQPDPDKLDEPDVSPVSQTVREQQS
ncbi:hypothetical protein [Candidatus Poriferisodalis sp.]|uniref:hypothetical protein n=1 Tax=Candidatus Poriferisodalis sp. TaxID=3101277 RepID=UPI003B527865